MRVFLTASLQKPQPTLTKNSFIIDILDAVPQADGEGAHQHVQVEEERRPRGRLVLRDRRDDRDVDLGVARVPERVEPGKEQRIIIYVIVMILCVEFTFGMQ